MEYWNQVLYYMYLIELLKELEGKEVIELDSLNEDERVGKAMRKILDEEDSHDDLPEFDDWEKDWIRSAMSEITEEIDTELIKKLNEISVNVIDFNPLFSIQENELYEQEIYVNHQVQTIKNLYLTELINELQYNPVLPYKESMELGFFSLKEPHQLDSDYNWGMDRENAWRATVEIGIIDRMYYVCERVRNMIIDAGYSVKCIHPRYHDLSDIQIEITKFGVFVKYFKIEER